MVMSRGNLSSANQYFASKIWTRHSKYKAMRAGPHSTPNLSPSEGLLAGYNAMRFWPRPH